jgi:septum formation protein
VALVRGSARVVDYERTQVCFRRLSKKDIDWYVGSGEPMDKAGGYAIQGGGAALVCALRGCYTNVIGLPIPKVVAMLAALKRSPGGFEAPA